MNDMIVALLVFLGCVHHSWQYCYSYNCDTRQSRLADCVFGTYECQATEFCEVVTHQVFQHSHGHTPYLTMGCRPLTELADCQSQQAVNSPQCSPNLHDHNCHWCCAGDSCLHAMANGILPTAGAGLPDVITTSSGPVTAGPTAGSTAGPAPASTTAASVPGSTCEDLYLGDCAVDYSGRCSEALVGRLCAKTCSLCH